MLERQLVVPVSPERLWEALTDPDAVATWMGASVEWELRPGGSALFCEDDGALRHGRVDEVVPGSYLRFRWWDDGGDGISEVTYQLEPDGGGTRLTVIEVPLTPSPVSASGATTSWTEWDARLTGVWGRISAPLGAVRG